MPPTPVHRPGTATLPILWVCMISATFAHPRGLFIVHFGWPAQQVSRAMRYYKMSIWLIVPLIMALITYTIVVASLKDAFEAMRRQ